MYKCLHQTICNLQVRNGILDNSPIMGRYCGDTPPVQVQTSGNTAEVIFRTDGSVTNGGFRASYDSNEPAGQIMMMSCLFFLL